MDKFYQTLFNGVPDSEVKPENLQLLFEQYKLYVDTMEKLVARRQTANNFFLTANAFLITLSGFSVDKLGNTDELSKNFSLIGISVSGILLSIIWLRLSQYYGLINRAKFSVIHALEKNLPVSLFLSEWVALGEGKDPKKYQSIAKIESRVAFIFIILYAVVGLLGVYSLVV